MSGLSRRKTEATPEVTEEVTKKEDGNLEFFFFFERMSTPKSRKRKFSTLTYSPTSVAPKCAANSHYSDIMPSCSPSCANPIPSEENPTSAKVAASLQQSSTNDVESGHPIPIPPVMPSADLKPVLLSLRKQEKEQHSGGISDNQRDLSMSSPARRNGSPLISFPCPSLFNFNYNSRDPLHMPWYIWYGQDSKLSISNGKTS